MRVGVGQEPVPLVWVKLHSLMRGQAVPDTATTCQWMYSLDDQQTYGLISLMMGFCTTLYPDLTNGQAVWKALLRADVHT